MSGIVWVEETASTNDDLRARAEGGAPHGTALAARHQTAGRGRLGRVWESPPGANLLVSVLVRRDLPAAKVPLLCLGAAVATADLAGRIYRIKWPNDVLAPDGRKVAGILAEADWSPGGGLQWAILGIGVNLAAAPLLATATTLLETDGVARDLEASAEALVAGVLREAEAVERDPAAMLGRWRRRSATLGKTVRIGDVEGVAVDVDPDGALRVRAADGREHRVVAGDVEMVRRA